MMRIHSNLAASSSNSASRAQAFTAGPQPLRPRAGAVAAASAPDRRDVLLASLAALATLQAAPAVQAIVRPTNKEVPNEDSPVIQAMLARTAEKREERRQERLDNYNRKVFKEYLDFEAGNAQAAKARGISDESSAAIQAWLEKNK